MASQERQRRSRAAYQELLSEHVESGLSLRAFAEAKGIKPATLYSRRRALRLQASTSEAPGLSRVVPLQIAVGSEPTPSDGGGNFELTIPGNRVLTIPPQFDAGALRRLLAVLGA